MGFNTLPSMGNILGFESKQEKYMFFAIILILVVFAGIMFYPSFSTYVSRNQMKTPSGMTSVEKTELSLEPAKTPKEYYDMFQCSCCGRSIDAGCCGSAKQRKAYADELMFEGLGENELVYKMIKKFGFDVLKDQSKEQEIREYIKSIAPENPPKIEIEPSKYDFGIISQADGVFSTIFTITNTGGSDLIIENMDTSCGCTSAAIVYNGIEGPRFSMSMHGDNPKNWEQVIPPGDSAQLKVYYDSMAHGIQDKPEMNIIRDVTIISNDPVDFQKKVRIEATQIP